MAKEHSGKPTTKSISLAFHAKVFAVAIKYSVIGLDKLAAEYFKLPLLALLTNEKFAARQDGTTEVADAVRFVYAATPEHVKDLRAVLLTVLVSRENKLLDDARVQAAIESVDGLTYELLKLRGAAAGPELENHPNCKKCSSKTMAYTCSKCSACIVDCPRCSDCPSHSAK